MLLPRLGEMFSLWLRPHLSPKPLRAPRSRSPAGLPEKGNAGQRPSGRLPRNKQGRSRTEAALEWRNRRPR